MKKFISGASLALLFTTAAFSQTASTGGSASTDTSTKVTKGDKSIDLSSAATITGKLQGSLDAEKAKVGDEVIIKTTKAVKENGKTVIEKGSHLVGRVTEVKQKTKDTAGSQIGVVFDTLKNGDQMVPVTASILSITNVATSARMDDTLGMDMSTSSTARTSTQSSSSGGGLLGGVTNTAGSAVNTATSAAGSVTNTAMNTTGNVVNTAGSTAGSTVGAVGTNIRGLQINQSADANANGSTTLGMNSGNLKLDSGTTFTVKVAGSASNGN